MYRSFLYKNTHFTAHLPFMKQHLKKWTLRLTVTGLLIAGLLLIIILNPILMYAGKIHYHACTIFHNKTPDPALSQRLDDAYRLLQKSECYRPGLHLDICLNDGSYYPKLIEKLRGPAFAFGFYDKVVLQGEAHFKNNYVALHGYTWNATQLLAHEMTHCMQFDHLGLRKSNPIAHIPDWKWEGYAEYVSRQNADQQHLVNNIARLEHSDKDAWAVTFDDGTIAPRTYYEYWILTQFCLDIKKMNYQQLLADTSARQVVQQEMMAWYHNTDLLTPGQVNRTSKK